jgi:chloramphenicol 3-O-phosphotransferase
MEVETGRRRPRATRQGVPSALDAPLSVLERRIRLREPAAPERELDGARWWTQHFHEARVEDHLVKTEDRPVDEIAREVLRLVDWLP